MFTKWSLQLSNIYVFRSIKKNCSNFTIVIVIRHAIASVVERDAFDATIARRRYKKQGKSS